MESEVTNGEESGELRTVSPSPFVQINRSANSICCSHRLNLSVQLASISQPVVLQIAWTFRSPFRVALLYYDYMLTFLDEVEYIWSQPRKLTTVFYVLCRYALIANPLYLLSVSTELLEVRDSLSQA